jgi:hypothetical protein
MSDTDTAYNLRFEERSGYLFARVSASRISEEIAFAYLDEVLIKCRAGGYRKLLLHRDIPAMLPDGDLFFVAAEFQRRLAGIKTAFVNPHEGNSETFDFAVTVGQNRGGTYGLFDNDIDAETWLLR